MNIVMKNLVVLGVLMLIPSVTGRAQSPQRQDLTVYISRPVGSLLGSGYASSYLTNIRARTIGQEDPKLRRAIDSLDALGMVEVKGFGLLPAAVAWQSHTSLRRVIAQQAETHLSYGELLMANVLAAESRHSLNYVIEKRSRTRTWGELAKQLQVSPELIVIPANAASTRIRAAEAQSRRRLQQRDPNTPSTNPSLHVYFAHR